jgi:DNA (cytosine-5)-methyltransferase 1
MGKQLRILDLFSGIGGFSLGLERAGMQTVAFCEIEPFCQAVLRKHWPNIPCYDDIRTLTAKRLAEDGIGPVDVICGGFPCQDISVAGKGAGITGSRSGLWAEYARLIGEIRPRYVIVENVAALLVRGMERVLGDLSEIGYDAEWHVISAADVGAPHLRKRVWIVAYPHDSESARLGQHGRPLLPIKESIRLGRSGAFMEDARSAGWGAGNLCHQGNNGRGISEGETTGTVEPGKTPPFMADTEEWGKPVNESSRGEAWRLGGASWWAVEPNVGRVANGVPSRVDRLRGLGNAVVPQIPEIIGKEIMQAEAN